MNPETRIFRLNQYTSIMNLRYKSTVFLFIVAYIIVTILAYGISFAAAEIYHLPSFQELGLTMFEDPAFVMTVPYHLLINLVIWTLFAWIYLRKGSPKEAVKLGIFWLVFAMIVDLIFFVLIKTPYSLTAHQFYVEYQPWITLTYLIVFVSPLLAGLMSARKHR